MKIDYAVPPDSAEERTVHRKPKAVKVESKMKDDTRGRYHNGLPPPIRGCPAAQQFHKPKD